MSCRVVITGFGSLSPNGLGNTECCRALLAGKSGVGRITRFDPDALPVHIAGELKNFDELAWMDAHERKHVSRAVPMAIAAASEALKNAGFDSATIANLSMEQRRKISVLHGSRRGVQDITDEQYRVVYSWI